MNQAHQRKGEERDQARLGGEEMKEMTRDLHAGKHREVVVAGQRKWPFPSLETEPVCLGSDAFRRSGTRGELGDQRGGLDGGASAVFQCPGGV